MSFPSYVQGEDDKEDLIDHDRKRWEEYERCELSKARKTEFGRLQRLEESSRQEEEQDREKREERRQLIQALATDTAKGRQEHQGEMLKREKAKLSRKELIQAKAKSISVTLKDTSSPYAGTSGHQSPPDSLPDKTEPSSSHSSQRSASLSLSNEDIDVVSIPPTKKRKVTED